MSREEFEKWAFNQCYGLWSAEGNAAWTAWQARQPEIDALRARVAELESAWHAKTMNRKDDVIAKQEKENDRLKARVAELERAVPAVPEQFKEWFLREVPEGTIIGNPEWWADRIAKRFMSAPAPVVPEVKS